MSRKEILTLFRKSNVLGFSLLGQQRKILNLKSCQLCDTSRLFGISHQRSFVSQTKKSLSQNKNERKEGDEEYTHFGYEKVKEDEKVDKGIIYIYMFIFY